MKAERRFVVVFLASTMPHKHYCLLPVLALTLAACQNANTPSATADTYLAAISKGNQQTLTQYRCWKEKAVEGLPQQIKSWEMAGERTTADERDPASSSTQVRAKVEVASVGGFPVTKLWSFDVWKSDEFFEHHKRAMNGINEVLVNGNKVTNEMRQMMGQDPLAPAKTFKPAERSELSDKPYCVLSAKEAE